MSFVHLHVHSHYSLLDGFGKPEDIVRAAKESGAPAVALTDHGVLYGAVEFYKAAKKAGIKPIIGCEVYVAPKSRFDKVPGPSGKPYHLVLLAKDQEGYHNLLELVSKGHLEGFYYKPRVDFGLLKAHSKGLIASTACLAGQIPRLIMQENEEKAIEVIKEYQEVFGKEDFYLEMQDHPEIERQIIVNKKLAELSGITGAPLIVTNDSHYVNTEDREVHDVLLCIQTGKSVLDEDRMRYNGDFSMKSPEIMKAAFPDHPEAIENTLKIAEKCNVDIDLGQNLLPNFPAPQNESPKNYLRKLCEEGIEKKYKPEERVAALKQLDYELDMVDTMGFNTYFLIVHDFIKFAKDRGILVGPGRGSAAGSVITYSLNITEVDPLKYGLIFERFLNPARVSMPDIDIDFADNRRDEVMKYVVEKYGRENVAQIITFGKMTAKAVVRDVGRALGYPYAEVDSIAKLIPPTILGKHAPLRDSVKNDKELNKLYKSDPRAKKLLDIGAKMDGTVRHAGTHACAVVISDKPLIGNAPLQRSPADPDAVITQYSMKPIEEIGLLKMDFLGLRNLTILETAVKIIKRTKNVEIDLEHIPLNDPETFTLFQKGTTSGVFQLESAGMRRYLKELKANAFEDIIAMISLYRPGPMEWIPQYIKGKHKPSSVKYLHPSFKEILNETNGVAIYQEQILQIAQKFAGFSLGEADLLRKAVGKKIPKLLQEQRKKFIEGAVAMEHKKKFAIEVFEKVIEPFAGYGFNKAHATCYAMISYQTAYLKANYPTEFMTALMSSDYGNTEKIFLEMLECEKMGIKVLPPSINESFRNFTYKDEKTIRFGIAAIKGIGDNPANAIIEARGEEPFKNLEDFINRVPKKILNKKLIEALAYSGAFDEMGKRKQIAENVEEIANYAKFYHKTKVEGQTDIFGMLEEDTDDSAEMSFQLKEVEPATRLEKLKWEKEYLGLYVSGHPLQGLTRYFSRKVNLMKNLKRKHIGKQIKIGGLVTQYRKIFTKSGSYMAAFVVEGPTGKLPVIIFPRAFKTSGHLIQEDGLVIMTGKVDDKRGQVQFVCESAKAVTLTTMINNAKRDDLYDPEEKMEFAILNLEKEETEEEKSENEIAEKPFVITLPGNFDQSILNDIKRLLLDNKGDTSCEIHIKAADSLKRIKVPFGISETNELKQKLGKLIN